MIELWPDGEPFDMIEIEPKHLNRVLQKRYVRERLVVMLAESLSNLDTFLGSSMNPAHGQWARDLAAKGIDDELIRRELRRAARRIRVAI